MATFASQGIGADGDAVPITSAARRLMPMMLSDAELEGFIRAYEKDFGETVSSAEAREMAARVLMAFELLATHPDPDTGAPIL